MITLSRKFVDDSSGCRFLEVGKPRKRPLRKIALALLESADPLEDSAEASCVSFPVDEHRMAGVTTTAGPMHALFGEYCRWRE